MTINRLNDPGSQEARPQAKLIARVAADGATSDYFLSFPVPDPAALVVCAPAKLVLGDGTVLDLGVLCAPTETTWARDRVVTLAEAVPVHDGQEATLVWGVHTYMAEVLEAAVGTAATQAVQATLSVTPHPDQPLVVVVQGRVAHMPPRRRIRLDGDAGNYEFWSPAPTTKSAGDGHFETLFGYPKPGEYTVSVDLIDDAGYWVETLARQTFTVAEPIADPLSAADAPEGLSERTESQGPEEVAVAALPPWLPFRYARPLWAWARTYTQPGGTVVSRSLALGTYLAIRQERMVGGQLWFQTGGFDWIPAAHVALLTPSDLRGVELAGVSPTPEPEPEPNPDNLPRGVVTATVLNVRSGPGTQFSVVDQLRYGAVVVIYAQQVVAGTTWYRIGANRWVHGGWIRLLSNQPPDPTPLRRGIVTADVLNVRARPGVSADNPPVDRLRRGAAVLIYAETVVAGATWYRIGVDRWVHSAWVQLVAALSDADPAACDPLQLPARATPPAAKLPVGWVVTSTVNVRAAPSTAAAVVGTLAYKARIDILEERTVAGQRWYRIGNERWVFAANIGAARFKARPSGIRANERWVGVNLSEQTVVAYEGDKPVYAALAATGLPKTPTVRGVFRTWLRLVSRRMSGGSAATGGYYYLEEVPWTCYFYSGYALHAAYWHDAFGRPRSHGCVNLSPYDAWWIFQWSAPGGANSPAVFVYNS